MSQPPVSASKLARYAADPHRFANEVDSADRQRAKAFGNQQHDSLMKLPLTKVAMLAMTIICVITAATVMAQGGGG
ncbi:hypothetical protein [Ferrimonas kyonanensis]|uniref:hypothetical protein n=1 Tax=Ferrimonas kyonanensis TaxID=364763 RepID=UPI00047FB121|nr:hypothetical protein [Ferrimonas kyonanensis]